jgi:hypothetical protein
LLETKYTILVSAVTSLVTLYPAEQPQELVTPVRAESDPAQAIESGRLSEAKAAAERH